MRKQSWSIAALALAGVVPSLAAQADTSLASRLEKAERAIAVLQQQIAEQSAAKVQPRSGNRVDLSGVVLMNGFFNNAKVNNPDIPTFVVTPDPPGFLPNSHLGATVRQSEFSLTATAPKVIGAAFTGELNVDFYGGHQNFARMFPIAHLKRMRAELRWPNAWVMFGQDASPISDVNPSSFAARGTPGFTSAGNLWFWIPQVRVGGDFGGEIRIGAEVTALAPVSTEAPVTFNPEPSRAERSRRPFGQARLLVTWDRPMSTGEVSVGGHYGWLSNITLDSLTPMRALGASARFTITRYVEIRGEGFWGEGLAVLGGGGVGQVLSPADRPVRAIGGWGQLNLHPHPDVEVGGGYGFDNPDDGDLNVNTARLKNLMIEGHAHYTPGPVVFAVEFRRIETTYLTLGRLSVHHINVGMGFQF